MSRKNGGIIGPANTPVGGFITGLAGGVWRMNDVANFVGNSQWPKVPENIDNSLRFNDGSSDNLSRTFSTPTNADIWTWSGWVKRSNIGAAYFDIFDAYTDSNSYAQISFHTNDYLFYYDQQGGSVKASLATNRLFRDISAWYHIVVATDTTQGTAADRIKLYINGEQYTWDRTTTYPSQNQDTYINSSNAHYFGTYGSGNYFDGYMAECVFIDGQQLDSTSFGEFDTTTGIWKPKKIGQIANAGTNSFYLNFKDSSNVGKDESGLGNNFTVNNLTSIDQSTDTCVVNYATMNSLAITNAGNTFSEGNLKITTISGASSYNQGTIGVSSGKWYWEIKYVSDTDGSNNYARIGIADIDPPNTGGLGETEGIAYEAINGKYKIRGSATTYGDTYAPGDIIGVALNLDDNELIFYKNGTAQNSGTAIDISSYTPKTGFWHPAFNYDDGSNSGVFEANFGSPSFSISSGNSDANGFGNFEYAVPSGYYALNTSNLNTYG